MICFVVYCFTEGRQNHSCDVRPSDHRRRNGKDIATIGALKVLEKYKERCDSVGLGKNSAESLVRRREGRWTVAASALGT
jgi:hypothetical protein